MLIRALLWLCFRGRAGPRSTPSPEVRLSFPNCVATNIITLLPPEPPRDPGLPSTGPIVETLNRNADNDARRAELLGAAARAITRLGFDHVRLRDVADEAGVSIGLLQHYFETRDQLGREAFAIVCRERADRITEASATARSSWERIETYLQVAFDWSELSERARAWLDVAAAAARDPSLKLQTSLSFEIWRSPLLTAIEKGTASGELNPIVEPEAAVDAILALIDGTEIRLVADDRDDAETIERTLATTTIVARHLLGPTG